MLVTDWHVTNMQKHVINILFCHQHKVTNITVTLILYDSIFPFEACQNLNKKENRLNVFDKVRKTDIIFDPGHRVKIFPVMHLLPLAVTNEYKYRLETQFLY